MQLITPDRTTLTLTIGKLIKAADTEPSMTQRRIKMKLKQLLGSLVAIIILAGCAHHQSSQSTSVVDFLYPEGTSQALERNIPQLRLPLTVGVAFVPENYFASNQTLTPLKQEQILREVAQRFENQPFIEQIEMIPSAYLRPKGGFANLQQLKRLYHIDVIALISYDQMQFTDQTKASIAYWTLVGAYLIKGEQNDTHTLMDTAVFDIDSQQLLFRAPGSHQLKSSATPIDLEHELRQNSAASFDHAATQMVDNLELALQRFKDEVKNKPEKVQLQYKHSASYGAGTIDGILMMLLVGFALCWLKIRRDPRPKA